MKQTKLFGAEEEPKIIPQLSLEDAKTLALQVEELVKPFCSKLEVVGSIRRGKLIVGDVDFIAISSDWTGIAKALKKAKVLCSGQSVTQLNCPCQDGFFQVDFYRATEQTWGIQELVRTGSAEHNIWLASYALSKGFKLKYSEGLMKDNVAVASSTEESIFAALGLLCPEPKQREIFDGKPFWLKTRN